MEPAPATPNSPSKALVVALVVGVVVVACGVAVLALVWTGVRTYVREAKLAEAKVAVAALARGVASCVNGEIAPSGAITRPAGLPATSPKVPASLSSVSARPFTGTPADWSDHAFVCGKFTGPAGPQHFQYQWVQLNSHEGAARAYGDLDGDGAVEVTVRAVVSCAGVAAKASCVAGPAEVAH